MKLIIFAFALASMAKHHKTKSTDSTDSTKTTTSSTPTPTSADSSMHNSSGSSSSSFNASMFLSTTSAYSTQKVNKETNVQEDMELVQIHLWCRHGTRFPTTSNLQDQIDLNKKLKESDGPLKDFTLSYSASDAELLSPVGERDAMGLGKRLLERYAKSNLTTDTKNFKFGLSNIDRSIKTGEFFFAGFLGSQEASQKLLNSSSARIVSNRTLDADEDPNKSCTKFGKTVGKKDSPQVATFQSTWLPDLTKRVNTQASLNLTDDEVSTMFDTCAFHLANDFLTRSQGVCQFFTDKDFLNYDATNDLSQWGLYGYNATISSKIACSTITGLVKDLNSSKPISHFHFNHAEAIMPLHSALGLNKDADKLTGSMSLTELEQRQWKTYQFSPFLGNVVMEVYKDKSGKKMIRTLADEGLIYLPACPGQEFCAVDDFVAYYQKAGVVGCDFDAICENPEKTIGGWSD